MTCEDCGGAGQTVQGWTDKNGSPEDQYGPCATCTAGGRKVDPPRQRSVGVAVMALGVVVLTGILVAPGVQLLASFADGAIFVTGILLTWAQR